MAALFTLTMVTAGFVAYFWALPTLVRHAWRAPRVPEKVFPDALGLDYQAVAIPTVGGKSLYGWWIRADAGSPTPAVVMLHGWGGNAQSLLPVAAQFYGAGFACLLIDARNHGRSDEDDFSSMVKFAEDLDHALGWVKAQPEIDPARIAVVGHSVGAAASLLCASRREDLAAVVSISAFAHPRKLMAALMSRKRIPYVPLGWWLLRYIERAIGVPYDAIAPVNTVARIRIPLLLVHGTEDQRVPVADAHAIHARRAGEQTQLLLVRAGHTARAALRIHGQSLVGFVQQACAARDGDTTSVPSPCDVS